MRERVAPRLLRCVGFSYGIGTAIIRASLNDKLTKKTRRFEGPEVGKR